MKDSYRIWFSFVYLLVWSFSSQSRISHSYGDVTITDEGLQILTYARHLWAVSSVNFFMISLPHLLWYETFVHTDHFRGPVTLTPNAERLTVELSLHVLTTYVCRGWDSNIKLSGANAVTHWATGFRLFCVFL